MSITLMGWLSVITILTLSFLPVHYAFSFRVRRLEIVVMPPSDRVEPAVKIKARRTVAAGSWRMTATVINRRAGT